MQHTLATMIWSMNIFSKHTVEVLKKIWEMVFVILGSVSSIFPSTAGHLKQLADFWSEKLNWTELSWADIWYLLHINYFIITNLSTGLIWFRGQIFLQKVFTLCMNKYLRLCSDLNIFKIKTRCIWANISILD